MYYFGTKIIEFVFINNEKEGLFSLFKIKMPGANPALKTLSPEFFSNNLYL